MRISNMNPKIFNILSFAGGNEQLESAAYMLTTFVILETVQNIFFDVGSSVALLGSTVMNIDMTALTLHQIKKYVEQMMLFN